MQAHFIAVNTTANDVIAVLKYDLYQLSQGQRRTKDLFEHWLQTSSTDMLSKFLQCVSGRPAITDNLQLKVCHTWFLNINVKVAWKTTNENYSLRSSSSPLDLTPKFSVCRDQIELGCWPFDKTEEEFISLMNASVLVCSDDNAWTLP